LLSDGFVIKEDVINQVSMTVTNGKKPALKNHLFTILISLLVHLLIIALLLFTVKKQLPKPVKNTNRAIQSYLYKIPTKTAIINLTPLIKEPKKSEITKVVKAQQKPKERILKEIHPKNKVNNIVKTAQKKKQSLSNNISQINKSNKGSLTEREPQSKTLITKTNAPVKFDSYKQLNSLRNSINKKIVEQEFSDLKKFKSSSIMHSDPTLVPHAYKKLTPEQVREKNTTKVSSDISIIKNDNGTCIIEREQFLGSPVEGSTSVFSCGESKFDRDFREHMKKIQDKIAPQRSY